MPSPQNNQGFVQPSSGGTGNWLSKLFGGVADRGRERSMAQLQLDLHAGKADVDTFHRKERTTWDMATKDAGAELAYDRSGREIDRGIIKGPEMTKAGLRGFDNAGRPSMQATGQKTKTEPAPTDGATVTNTPTSTSPLARFLYYISADLETLCYIDMQIWSKQLVCMTQIVVYRLHLTYIKIVQVLQNGIIVNL